MPDETEWVHELAPRRAGEVIAWRDDRSPTGLLSGIVVQYDHTTLRALVRDLRAAKITGGIINA